MSLKIHLPASFCDYAVTVIAIVILTFAYALGEFGATLMLPGNVKSSS